MKLLISITTFLVCALETNAQTTYTEHLQQAAPVGSGIGTVTIVEDKTITDLVNGQSIQTQTTKTQTVKPVEKGEKVKKVEKVDDEDDDTAVTPPAVDYSKKIMKNAIKVDGFRVQIYSGGNSRIDKNKATQIGHQIKSHFPDQPVYVHFKSPHWICRMGNYRTRSEAQAFLQQVSELGYKEAIIVKGKISIAK